MNNTNILRDLLLSDNNIYKSILSVESYLFNPQLLTSIDIRLLNELNDKFNYKLLYRKSDDTITEEFEKYDEEVSDILLNGGLIGAIQRRITSVLDNDEMLFKTKVFFKVKDASVPKYRPLHTTNLLDSIAIVSMLQVLIFDMKKDDKNPEVKLSNLSRLIPSNFYGNVPSKQPERLFDKWQVKYKAYTEKINEKFVFHKENGKYKSEVVLDLVDFFPSINTGLVFDFIIESLEVKYSDVDLEKMKKVMFKLLYFEVENFSNECESVINKQYYKGDIKNYTRQGSRKASKKYLTKGIPQGLPQSYFFGNLVMISISGIYDKVFEGEAYYYVDDSVIYTNEFESRDDFVRLLLRVNDYLRKYSEDVPPDVEEYYRLSFYMVKNSLFYMMAFFYT